MKATSNTIAPAVTAETLQVRQDWDNDGFLRISGARTIKRYLDLMYTQATNLPVNEWGLFFAFDQGQFDFGYKDLVKRGLIKDGDKIKSFGNGCFGTSEAMTRWAEAINAIEDKIRKECDPYEVYLEEYNNFECCIDWDGDDRAVEKVISIFGVERTREAIEGRRFRAYSTIDMVAESMTRN